MALISCQVNSCDCRQGVGTSVVQLGHVFLPCTSVATILDALMLDGIGHELSTGMGSAERGQERCTTHFYLSLALRIIGIDYAALCCIL